MWKDGDRVTWALRSPSNTMRDFYSLFLLTGETGYWAGGAFALVIQIKSGGAKSAPRPAVPHPTPSLLLDTWHSAMGEGSTRLPGDLGGERPRVGNVGN